MKHPDFAFQRTCLSKLICIALGSGAMWLGAGAASAAEAGADAQAAKPLPSPEEPAPQREDSGLPLTKVVVSRKDIESGAEQEGYGEAVKNVPGAMSNNGKGSANDAIRFRGLQLGLYSNYRINGGLAITNVITIPTEDKEKVEALKGANALMFGLASPAGILNMVTKRAGKKDVTTLTLSGNSFGQYGAAVDLGRQFGTDKQFGVRVNASGTHIETGVHGIGGSGEFFSVAGDWRATRSLTFRIDYENYRKDVVEQAGIVPPTAVNGVIAIPKVPDPRNLLSGPWDVYTPRTENAVARVEYKIAPGWEALAEFGKSKSQRSRTQARVTLTNVDTGDGKENILFIHDQRYENTYQKVELQGRFSTWSLGHALTVGYSSAQRDSNIPSTYSPLPANNNKPINIYAPVEMPAPIDSNTPLTYLPNSSKDSGLYIYDTLSIGRDIKLLAGLRKTDYSFSQARVPNGPLMTTKFKPTAEGVGILYDITPQTTIYSSYMQAMEDGPIAPSGPIQGKTVSNAFAVLEPSISTQREIGIRSTFFSGVYFNLDYFDIVKKNTNLVPDSPTSVAFQYDGTLHLYGIELQANAAIARGWELSGSAQLMRARQQGGANDGKSTENTPESIIGVNLQHQPAWAPGLTLRAGASYVSSRFIGNAEQGAIPSVTLLSAGASYQTRIAGTKTSFQLGIENLANKRYWNSATSSAFGAGMDRSIRFSAKFDF
jgi:iron complex outermembrane receptor protein